MGGLKRTLYLGFTGHLYSKSELFEDLMGRTDEEICNLDFKDMYKNMEREIGRTRAYNRVKFYVGGVSEFLDLHRPISKIGVMGKLEKELDRLDSYRNNGHKSHIRNKKRRFKINLCLKSNS